MYKCFLYASVEIISTKCSMWDCRQLKNANLAKFFFIIMTDDFLKHFLSVDVLNSNAYFNTYDTYKHDLKK